MNKGALIPVHELHMGQQVVLVPVESDTAGGSSRGPLATAGEVVSVNDYHFGLIQRGAARAYEVVA